MKKYTILLLILFSMQAFAQQRSWTLKAGAYFPLDLKTGTMFGADYGYAVDETVTLLFGGDFYYRGIRNDADLGDAEKLGVKISTGEHLSKWTGWHLPLTFKIRLTFPTQNERLTPFGIAGLGYGITYVSYDIYNDARKFPSESSLTYSGFVWQVGGGVLYQIGRNSELMGELIYNGASFEKDEENNRYTTLNSSGVILRAGINLYIF
jgi:opacity protein-like surface antigen